MPAAFRYSPRPHALRASSYPGKACEPAAAETAVNDRTSGLEGRLATRAASPEPG